jgi:hypothetical protein
VCVGHRLVGAIRTSSSREFPISRTVGNNFFEAPRGGGPRRGFSASRQGTVRILGKVQNSKLTQSSLRPASKIDFEPFDRDARSIPDLSKLNMSNEFAPGAIVQIPYPYDEVFRPRYPIDIVGEIRRVETCYPLQSRNLRGRNHTPPLEGQFARLNELYFNSLVLQFWKKPSVPTLVCNLIENNRFTPQELEKMHRGTPATNLDLSLFQPFLHAPLSLAVVSPILESSSRDFRLNGDFDEGYLKIEGVYLETFREVATYGIRMMLSGRGGWEKKLPAMEGSFEEVKDTLDEIEYFGHQKEAPGTRLIYTGKA